MMQDLAMTMHDPVPNSSVILSHDLQDLVVVLVGSCVIFIWARNVHQY